MLSTAAALVLWSGSSGGGVLVLGLAPEPAPGVMRAPAGVSVGAACAKDGSGVPLCRGGVSVCSQPGLEGVLGAGVPGEQARDGLRAGVCS